MSPVGSRTEASRYGHIVVATVLYFTSAKVQESVELTGSVASHVRGLALAKISDSS
jgi:hypothetical protein